MAGIVSEFVTIESSYVYFGTLRLLVVKPTVVHPNHIIINVYDVNGAQRLSIQIASKHICKALLCQSGEQKAIAFLVNRFCAGKIRETLQISTVPEATIGNRAPYFDSESARICQRYILVDITKCSSDDMDLLKRVLRVVEETKLLIKAQNIAQGMVVNTSSGAFLGNMDEKDFVNLMRDIGLNEEQIAGSIPNLATRLVGNRTMSSIASAASPTQPSQVNLQELIRSPNVQRIRNVGYYQQYGSRIVQQRPVTINIVRVVPYQDSSAPMVSNPSIHVADGHNTVIAQPITLSRNKHIVGGAPPKKVSVVTQSNVQTRIVKQPINVSQPIFGITASEPSTSRFGILKAEGTNASHSGKRVVHVIDDDDESSSIARAKEPRLDLLLNYPRDQPNSISVHYADVEYLRPNEMLNDTIIEFYLKYIQMELIPPEKRSSVFIFNPFFYSRLTQMPSAGPSVIRTVSSRAKWIAENYKGLRTWTKNVDIFKADYIVVPIVEDIHWYLAIITFPRYAIMNRKMEADDDDDDDYDEGESIIPKKLRKARIIILDSLADATDMKRKLTFTVLREYLVCEYEDKRKKKDRELKYVAKERIEKIVPFPVPQQRNYTDCGLFLLKFAECFLLKPPIFITRNDSFRRWYPNFTIRGMRRSILAKLKSACDEEAWRAYEEYSRKCDVNSQSIEAALPEQSSKDRSPSPLLRRRTLSTGDHNVDMRGYYSKRRRSLPARLPSC